MIHKIFLFFLFVYLGSGLHVQAQNNAQIDSLKREIMNMKVELEATQANLRLSHPRFKRGIFTSAIGYSIVIAGGIFLATKDYSN